MHDHLQIKFIQEYMNIGRVQPFFGTNMQLQNKFHLQPLLKPVALNHGKKKVCHCQDLDEPRLQLKWIKST